MTARPDLPAFFPTATRAQSLKPDLLAMNHKTLLQSFDNRNRQSDKAAYYTASFTGEVRVALAFSAPVGQFEMPCSFVHKGLMYQTGLAEAFQCTINRDFIGDDRCKVSRNLPLGQRFACLQQNPENRHSRARSVKVRSH
jgi:hypothetical protein